MWCKYKNIVQWHILYVAKTYIICYKDKIYTLQRQTLYVAKTKFICYKDKCICYREKYVCYKDKIYVLWRQIYMLYKHNLYVIKTKFICCRDKKLGARAERARRGFFSPKKRHSYFLRTQYSCFVSETDKTPLKSTVLGLSAPAGAFFLLERSMLILWERNVAVSAL